MTPGEEEYREGKGRSENSGQEKTNPDESFDSPGFSLIRLASLILGVPIWLAPMRGCRIILRKEVIQPQVPLRLPCYDLVPITSFIFGAYPLAVSTATSDAPRFRGLTGGVYKAHDHIHRSIADLRLLAIPAS